MSEAMPKKDIPANGNGAADGMMRRAAFAAVAVAVTLVTLKAIVYWTTDSVAMLGTLMDSLLDGAASLLNLIAVRASLLPPDNEHRFGHGKAEALAGLGQSIFIFGSAGYLTYEGVSRLIDPKPVASTEAGIAVVIIAILLTLALVAYQRHVVKQTGSLAIEADSIHYRGDLFMNLSVIAALVLSGYFGLHRADAVFGLVIAGLIAWSAGKIVLNSLDQLMDREFTEEERARIKDIAHAHEAVLSLHDLKTRRSGIYSFIQFHIELDGKMTLHDAHDITDAVERDVLAAFPGSEVIIHQDPAGAETLTKFQLS
ncbi:cation diffusion facilitator family transporter [Parvibaculum sp.]|jgi:ferrous-iron efflux pump FieF|uniref:cation diffusion facilitator family transporter n=1 Tax=Parvibaculum sp. TaxID=2024848 RepID=UPI00391D2033